MPEFHITASNHPKMGAKFNAVKQFPDFLNNKKITIISGESIE